LIRHTWPNLSFISTIAPKRKHHMQVQFLFLYKLILTFDSLSPRFNFSPYAHNCTFFVSMNIEEYTAHVTLNNSQSVWRYFIQSFFGQSKLYYMIHPTSFCPQCELCICFAQFLFRYQLVFSVFQIAEYFVDMSIR
jgi:hypothetical protein